MSDLGVTGTSKEDKSLTNGTTYYYTIRAVDVTGNESINVSQLEAKPDAAVSLILPKTGSDQPSGWLMPLALFGLALGRKTMLNRAQK